MQTIGIKGLYTSLAVNEIVEDTFGREIKNY